MFCRSTSGFTDIVMFAHNGIKVKYMDIAVRGLTSYTATETHMPYRITQCYLPPDKGDIPAFIPQPKLVLD